MKPLLFLTGRSIVNGLRRALTSPKRLIATLVIGAYYFWIFGGRFLTAGGGGMPSRMRGFGATPQFSFPALSVIEAFAFSLFAAVSFFLVIGLFGYRASFKAADVDVLFPTPISPRIVLAFRMARDYLATLLVPLILIVVGFRSATTGLDLIFRNVPNPATAGYTIRAFSLGMLLLTLAWVTMGYALSLYLNRNDRRSDMRKRIIAWAIGISSALIGSYIYARALQIGSLDDFVSLTHSAWVRGFFFTATPASSITMGPLEGNLSEMLIGAGVLICISAVSILLSLRQAGWMYDQAAVRGFSSDTLRQLQRKGDMFGMVAESARAGRYKPKKAVWLQRIKTRGFGALIWKSALIQWRTVRILIFLFTLAALGMSLGPVFGLEKSKAVDAGYMVMGMQGFAIFMVATILSQNGFTELLRRVDLQKPLPFSPATIIAAEVLATAAPCIVVSLTASVVATLVLPAIWQHAFAAIIFGPSIAILICSAMCLITLLFPEIDDVAQRGFRGIITLLGVAVLGTPGLAVLIVAIVGANQPLLGAIPGALINLAMSAGVMIAASGLYAGFNPSE